jgi:very-short-patch-repair endonuclease
MDSAAKRHRIPPERTERARQLRREMTMPERLLWSKLRARRLEGLKFRRQFVIGPYVADFCCPEKRLVVELDGDSHAGMEARDARRTAYLMAQGYRVIRYQNRDVLRDPTIIAEAIARELGLME